MTVLLEYIDLKLLYVKNFLEWDNLVNCELFANILLTF